MPTKYETLRNGNTEQLLAELRATREIKVPLARVAVRKVLAEDGVMTYEEIIDLVDLADDELRDLEITDERKKV